MSWNLKYTFVRYLRPCLLDLRPLEHEIRRRGDSAAWLSKRIVGCAGGEVRI